MAPRRSSTIAGVTSPCRNADKTDSSSVPDEFPEPSLPREIRQTGELFKGDTSTDLRLAALRTAIRAGAETEAVVISYVTKISVGNGVSVSVSASDMSPGEDVESHVSAGVKLTLQVVESEFPCPQVTVTFAVTVVGNLPSFAIITFVNSSGDGGSSQHVATTLNLTGVLFAQHLYV